MDNVAQLQNDLAQEWLTGAVKTVGEGNAVAVAVVGAVVMKGGDVVFVATGVGLPEAAEAIVQDTAAVFSRAVSDKEFSCKLHELAQEANKTELPPVEKADA